VHLFSYRHKSLSLRGNTNRQPIFLRRISGQYYAATLRRKFQNAALFLRLGLPSTLYRHANGALRKRSSNWRNLKAQALRLEFTENFSFSKTMTLRQFDLTVRDFLNHQSKMTGYCYVLNFLRRGEDGKDWMRFQNENFVFKFLGVVWARA